MSIEIPESTKEVVSRSKADVQRELGQFEILIKNNWLSAIVVSCANRIFDFYIQLSAAIKESFPDTATGSFLVRWAAIWGKQRQVATKSSGRVVATGTAGSIIPLGTIMAASGVGNFLSTAAATIAASTINIDDLVRSGSTVTATTPSDHGLANGVEVTIAGAANSEYNITADIVVTGTDTFQYEIVGTPVDEIGTSATASFTVAGVSVESEDFGSEVNLSAGANLTLQSPISGVDDALVVDFDEVSGGTDQETEESLRDRTLDRIQNPVAHFNVTDITDKAKEIAGVTRVFVEEITPAVGQVTIYFMRDNDTNPIPPGSEVTKVKNKILEIKPANTSDADVIVAAPTAIPVNFTFTDLSPNTQTMKDAITANLQQFFEERTTVGVNIDEDLYRSAITNTVDTVTGGTVETFTLSVPSGDITINTGEIGTLGSIVYP